MLNIILGKMTHRVMYLISHLVVVVLTPKVKMVL